MCVVMLNELVDLENQIFNTFKCSSTCCTLGNEIEPPLNLIQPGSIRRCVMNLKPGMNCKPPFDRWMFMGAVIIHIFVPTHGIQLLKIIHRNIEQEQVHQEMRLVQQVGGKDWIV